jgi:hypothetical protein
VFVLLGNAAENRGARFCARRIERDHHATLVDFRDGNPRCVSHANNLAHPVQLIEGFATLQIDQQVWAKAPRVLPRFRFPPRFELSSGG